MKPSATKKNLWIVALIFGILGIVGHFAQVQYLTQYNFQLLFGGFVLFGSWRDFKGYLSFALF